AIPLAKDSGLVIAVANRINQLVHESFKREICDLKVGIRGLDRMAGCLNEMSLSETDSAIKIQWIICSARRLGHGLAAACAKRLHSATTKDEKVYFSLRAEFVLSMNWADSSSGADAIGVDTA